MISDAAALLITVVYLRQVCSQRVLSELLGVNPNSIGEIIAETRMLFDERGHHVTPIIGLRLNTAADLVGFVREDRVLGPAPNRLLPETLSHPALTGMSRRQLDELVERLAVRQSAMVERRRYAQRGGERMPGGRGGIFLQKITDAERVLATVLHLRRLCTRAVLAELFQVSPRTIGNALLDVRPLLEQDGYIPVPAPIRYRTAAELLAAIPPHESDTSESIP